MVHWSDCPALLATFNTLFWAYDTKMATDGYWAGKTVIVRASLTSFHSCLNIHDIYSTINSRNLSKRNVISSPICSCASVSTNILWENASNGPCAILETETIIVERINLLVLWIPPFYSWFRNACCLALKWSVVALCKPSDGRCRFSNDLGFICKT